MSYDLYPNPPVYTREQAQAILSRIVDERDRIDTLLDEREPPEEPLPYAECAACDDLYLCSSFDFPDTEDRAVVCGIQEAT